MPTLEKLDLYKQYKQDYASPSKQPVLLDIARARYLAVEGFGAPGGEAFTTGIEALYGMAYTMKMTHKAQGGQDYTVCKLEARWWVEGEKPLEDVPLTQWQWQMMIRTPDFMGEQARAAAVEKLLRKGKDPQVAEVKLLDLEEGRCVQMLHVGPYEQEGQTIAVMRSFAEEQGLTLCGRHHEIYLSDPRRVAPEKLKTILRHPVK